MPREQKPFEDRIRRIQRRHRRLARGFVLKVNKNNLIVQSPQHLRFAFPWRALCIALMVGLGFKAYLIANLGAPVYAEKVALLAQGQPLERAGAWVMRPDPASGAVARVFRMMQG